MRLETTCASAVVEADVPSLGLPMSSLGVVSVSRVVSLSPRLRAIVSLIQPTGVLADIGTDHGLIPVYAVQSKLVKYADACDLRAAPLEGARRLVQAQKLHDQVTLLRGDGLSVLEGRVVHTVVVAGMSGKSICGILERSPRIADNIQTLIAQPNRGAHLVRRWARRSGFHLHEESIIAENGRHFITCSFVRRAGSDPIYGDPMLQAMDAEQWGPHLIRRGEPSALEYFQFQKERLRDCTARNPQADKFALKSVDRVIDHLTKTTPSIR